MKSYLPVGSHLGSSHHSADLSSPSWDHILQKHGFWTLPGLRLWHLALLLVSTASLVFSATPVQVVAFLDRFPLFFSYVIFLFPSYLNLKTITWPGLVMTAPRHFVAESLSFSADSPHSTLLHIENERQGCWNVTCLN